MDFEDVYATIGSCGRFQQKAFFAYMIENVFIGTLMIQNVFVGHAPGVLCQSNSSLSGCDKLCERVQYDDSFISFAAEWGMVCGAEKKTAESHTQSIFMFGVMVGSLFMGHFADKYGRFRTFFGAHLLTTLFAMCSAFASGWTVYASLRFFTGFFMSGIDMVGFVLTAELMGRQRGIVATLPALAFAIGIEVLVFASWSIQQWRRLSYTLALIGVMLTPVIYYVFEESPHWHLTRGNKEKCETILRRISSVNGSTVDTFDLKITKQDRQSSKSSLFTLLRHPVLRKFTAVQILAWFANSAIYYGFSLASGDIGGNRYVSVALNSLVDLPSSLLSLVFMDSPRFGRIRSLVGSMVISALCCISMMLVGDKRSSVSIALACCGKFFICISFNVIYVQGAELYPTPVRNMAVGLLGVSSRIGGVLAPLILDQGDKNSNQGFLLFGVVGFVSGILGLLLPETLGRPLPETTEDICSREKSLSMEHLVYRPKQTRLSDASSDIDELQPIHN